MNAVDRLVELDVLPERILRAAIRANLSRRLRSERRRRPAERRAFVDALRTSPIALEPAKPNEQHYEEPAGFFELVLGPRLKYSACLWDGGAQTLAEAEEAMLALTCERAGLADGMEVLDLGCGWGSLALYAAERYPRARITAVSNSRSQRAWIGERAPANLTVLTQDANELSLEGRFDRVVSIEMFEHMRNYEQLLADIAQLLAPRGRLFVHVFCHREHAYPYDDGWMARNFFTAGLMPSEDLLAGFQEDLELVEQWRVPGENYARTAEAWLANLDARAETIESLWGRAFLARWRLFFLSCAELFAYRGGTEWFVAHYLFAPR